MSTVPVPTVPVLITPLPATRRDPLTVSVEEGLFRPIPTFPFKLLLYMFPNGT